MTNTPNKASIVIPLVWTHYSDKFSEARTNVDHVTVFQVRYDEGAKVFLAVKNKFPMVSKILALGQTKEEMLNICQQEYEKNVLINIDLTKLQQPEPFWKPIKQCPLKDNTKYDLYIKTKHGLHREPDCIFEHNSWCKTKVMGEDGSLHNLPLFEFFDEFNVLAFAEIPPCEVKP